MEGMREVWADTHSLMMLVFIELNLKRMGKFVYIVFDDEDERVLIAK